MIQLSKQQRAALAALAEGRLTTVELAVRAGTKRGTGAMLQSLYQQGFIRYIGGPGVRVGKGWWQLTDRGTIVNAEGT